MIFLNKKQFKHEQKIYKVSLNSCRSQVYQKIFSGIILTESLIDKNSYESAIIGGKNPIRLEDPHKVIYCFQSHLEPYSEKKILSEERLVLSHKECI